VYAEAIMLTSAAPIVRAPEPTARREAEISDAAQAADAVAVQRSWGGNRLADAIFKILCVLIGGFLILVFGVVGGFYFYMVN
jgi:hypothetical protein